MFFRNYFRKNIIWIILAAAVILMLIPVLTMRNDMNKAGEAAYASGDGYIKYVEFNPTVTELKQALQYDINTYGEKVHLNWIELLAYAAAKTGGKFDGKENENISYAAQKLLSGTTIEELTDGMEYYKYYFKAYSAVLSEFVGEYKIEVYDETSADKKRLASKYGLKVFSPIAKGYGFTHYEDFGNKRSYGYEREHLGNDIMGATGTPIVAVEGGIVEAIGWNQYGGWRVGIRSFDGQRYYYYAHLRKDHPYHKSIDEGSVVSAGDVIGYMGQTGYSTEENVNNITTPHLHFGLQIIFDESQKDGTNQIWIDVYNIVELLSSCKSAVVKDEITKDYNRIYNIVNYVSTEEVLSDEVQKSIQLPIIMYHSILKDEKYSGDYVITPDTLESDLIWLKENGFSTVNVQDIVDFVHYDGVLPDNPIMLTFDDGYLNNYTYAYPLLEKYGYKAVVSAVGEFADKFSKAEDHSPSYSHMTWDDLKKISESGIFEVQNHSYGMHYINSRKGSSRMGGETLEAYKESFYGDTMRMQNCLTTLCGITPICYTYPYGAISEDSRDILKEMGFMASLSCYELRSTIIQGDGDSLFELGRYNRPSGITTEAFMKKLLQ